MAPALEIEPYFAARIKTLAQLRISCSPKSHLPLRHPRDRHASPTMLDASLSSGPQHINGNATPDSPAVDSPATPVDNNAADDVKIDLDFDEHESDVRHEPVTLKVTDASSVLPQVGTPVDPGEITALGLLFSVSYTLPATIPIEPPKGTPPPPAGELLEDVRMAEEPSHPSLPAEDTDAHMADAEAPLLPANGQVDGLKPESPAATPLSASIPAVSSSETAVDSIAPSSPYPNNTIAVDHDDDDKPPPAKRARKHSDAERASLANVSPLTLYAITGVLISSHRTRMKTGTPPPPSVSPEVDSNLPLPPAGPSTLSMQQWRFCSSTIRTLRRLKEAGPFLHPVDIVGLNIPHYPSIVKHPMDLSTVDRKLASSNPQKIDPNPSSPRYYNTDEFIADVRLIFGNALAFNGNEHPVYLMGKRVEDVFDKQIKQMPPPDQVRVCFRITTLALC